MHNLQKINYNFIEKIKELPPGKMPFSCYYLHFWASVMFLLQESLFVQETGGKAVYGNQFPRFQKNFWFEYSTPQSTSYPANVFDYHKLSETTTPVPNFGPRILESHIMENVTTQLGASVDLNCIVKQLNNRDELVSWLKRDPVTSELLELLTFGTTVYVNDIRISVKKIRSRIIGMGGDNWSLSILNAKKSDEGIYECQISTEVPQVKRIHLVVEAPVLTVMDGFGRELNDQYYKVGSSLEVMCTVDRLPARPLPGIIEWRQGNRKLSQQNTSFGQSIRTELEGFGAISRLAITQANVKHSGIYTCSVSDVISQSLRLHIIDESSAKPIINNQSNQVLISKATSLFLLISVALFK